MARRALFSGVLAFWLLTAQETPPEIRLEHIVSGLNLPTDIQHAPDGTDRLFVVEQDGRIRIVENGAVLPDPFLDISDRVTPRQDLFEETVLLVPQSRQRINSGRSPCRRIASENRGA